MALSLGFKGGVIGIGVESTYGTAVARTLFHDINSEGIAKEIEAIHSEALPDVSMDNDEFNLGIVTVAGEFETEMRYSGLETIIKHAMGGAATAETASFVVAASNDTIDFNIGAGALVATVAASTYTTADLCTAIDTALSTADATGTYTVSFSTVTNKFTIARSEGTLNILWNNGANVSQTIAALIGYSTAANDTGAISYAADTAVVPVYTSTFTIADDLPTGLTIEVDRDQTAFIAEGCKVNTMSMAFEVGGLVKSTFGIVAEDMNTGAVTSSTLPTAPYILFSQGAITYNSASINVIGGSLSINNNLKTDRRFIGSRVISEPTRNGKLEVNGSLTLEFVDTTQYDDFVAGTARAVALTFTGATNSIKTGQAYSMTITLPQIRVTGAPIKADNAGPLTVEVPFKAYATDGSTREMSIALKNTLNTVS
jgi:hypothetical protein